MRPCGVLRQRNDLKNAQVDETVWYGLSQTRQATQQASKPGDMGQSAARCGGELRRRSAVRRRPSPHEGIYSGGWSRAERAGIRLARFADVASIALTSHCASGAFASGPGAIGRGPAAGSSAEVYICRNVCLEISGSGRWRCETSRTFRNRGRRHLFRDCFQIRLRSWICIIVQKGQQNNSTLFLSPSKQLMRQASTGVILK